MKGKFSIPCWFLLIFCRERRHIFALELHVFPNYFLLHSDFSIWSLSQFLNLDPAYDVLSEYQVAYIDIENIKTVEFEVMISQLQGNSRNKINVFINPSNTSRLQNISKSISQVPKADKTNSSNSLDRDENNWRASYFIFLSAITNSENEIPFQDLLHSENLNTVAKWFTLQSDIYAVKLSKEFTTIVELYSIGKTPIVETVFKKASTRNISGKLLSDIIDMTILRKVSRRRNFHLTPVVAVSQSGSTNRVEMKEYENGSAILISGHEIEEYRFLRDYLNFSEKAVNSSGWAYQNEQGILMGMASQLLRNEADIAITNSELIETWLEEIVFLHPTFYSKLRRITNPPNSSIREIFIQAFTVNVWLAVFSTWIIIISVMISLAWLIQLKLHSLHESEQTFVRELLLWASGSACQQGWYIYPESIPLQIALICSAIMSSLLLIAYSAALVSILSLNILPVKSVDDLIHQKFSIYRGNEIYSTNHVLDELVSKGKIIENRAISSGEAVTSSSRGILKSKFALIGIADVFHPIIKSKGISDQELCSHLSHVPVNWRPITAAMFLPKKSQYKEYFNYVLVKMHERGNRYRVLNNYMKNSITLCLQNESFKKDPLEMSDVFTAFAIWSAGMILCLVGFSFEKILFSTKRKIFLI